MSQDKKPRTMSPKGFLSKATKPNISAIAFMDRCREYMCTGELAPLLSPIVAKLDSGALLPTPALHEVGNAVVNHIIAIERNKFEQTLERQASQGQSKPWIASILNAEGVIQTCLNQQGEEKDLIQTFADASSASRWIDRKLFDGASDWHGLIEHDTMPIAEQIERPDSIARLLKPKKSPITNQKSKTTGALSFRMTVREDRAVFSRG